MRISDRIGFLKILISSPIHLPKELYLNTELMICRLSSKNLRTVLFIDPLLYAGKHILNLRHHGTCKKIKIHSLI